MMRRRDRVVDENEVVASRHHFEHRGRGTLVRDVHDVDLHHVLQQQDGQVARRVVTRRSEIDLARVGTSVCDHLLGVTGRKARMRNEHVRGEIKLRDHREVFHRVVRHLLVDKVRKDMRIGRDDDKGVAVRIRPGNRLARNQSASAAAVLVNDGLAQQLRHFRGDRPGDHIGAATGRIRYDPTHRLGRISALRAGVRH